MSNVPDQSGNGQQGQQQQTARPDVPAQPGAPQGPAPSMQQQPTQQPTQHPTQQPVPQPMQQQQPMQQLPAQQQPPQPPSGQVSRPMLVQSAATRVTGRRVVQYIIDYILAGIIPGLAYWLLDTGAGAIGGVRWFAATVIALAAYFAYWVAIPYASDGQTLGMKLFRLRVLSKDGAKASMLQLFIRGVFLIVDTLFFGLVGYITILCSRYRQRVGDHVAGTVVVSAGYGSRYSPRF